jgi:hypothetical protein
VSDREDRSRQRGSRNERCKAIPVHGVRLCEGSMTV